MAGLLTESDDEADFNQLILEDDIDGLNTFNSELKFKFAARYQSQKIAACAANVPALIKLHNLHSFFSHFDIFILITFFIFFFRCRRRHTFFSASRVQFYIKKICFVFPFITH